MVLSKGEEMIEKLKEYIQKEGLTQRQVAVKLGAGEGQVNQWLNGKHKVSLAWQELIFLKLGIRL